MWVFYKIKTSNAAKSKQWCICVSLTPHRILDYIAQWRADPAGVRDVHLPWFWLYCSIDNRLRRKPHSIPDTLFSGTMCSKCKGKKIIFAFRRQRAVTKIAKQSNKMNLVLIIQILLIFNIMCYSVAKNNKTQRGGISLASTQITAIVLGVVLVVVLVALFIRCVIR